MKDWQIILALVAAMVFTLFIADSFNPCAVASDSGGCRE